MFELFIALFGGIYYGGKYLNEKSKLKSFDRAQEERRTYREYIKNKYCVSYEYSQEIKSRILSGEYYEDICNEFENDFKFVLGCDWKEKLRIPPKPLNYVVDKKYLYTSFIPCNHIYWVYHLLLAKDGKLDERIPSWGFSIGGTKDKEMNVKFAQCIEGQLLNAGVTDIRLALELETDCCGQRTPDRLEGGSIVIESLSHCPTHRLWNNHTLR